MPVSSGLSVIKMRLVAPNFGLLSFIKHQSVKGENGFKTADHRHFPIAS